MPTLGSGRPVSPPLPLSLCNLGRALNPSEPQFLYLSNGDRSAQLPALLRKARRGKADPRLDEALPLTPPPQTPGSQAP